MLSSRTRNSILDWLLAATIAVAVISGLAGIDLDFGPVSLRSHSAFRVLILTAVLLAVRLRAGIASTSEWAFRVAMLTAIALSVAAWLRFLLTTVGGADSYGYVSASRLLLSGRLVDPQPIAAWLTTANPLALASPLGWAPAADGAGIVPTYPLGLPMVMALMSAVAGPGAVFAAAPLFALATLVMVYRITRRFWDQETALLAAAVVACNPVFVVYAKQPMSDGPATAWVVLGVALAMHASSSSAAAAGLAAGLAALTRPALLIAGATIASMRIRAAVVFAAVVAVQMFLNWRMFGHALSTGYGTSEALFSTSHAAANLSIFARQGWVTLGPLVLGGLVVGFAVTRRELLWRVLAVSAAVIVPYVFYLPFDHWETLRFLLPAIVLLLIPASAGLMWIARQLPNAHVARAIAIAFVAAIAFRSESLLRESSAWDIQSIEQRYPLAGQWLNVNTPANSLALASQHSGSLRWYGQRPTLRWDLMQPHELVTTVEALEGQGQTVYVALEGVEVEMFDTRFAVVVDRLRVDHVGRVRNVHFRRLSTREPASLLRNP